MPLTHKTLISGANVVLPHGIERTDVLIDGDRIASIGPPTSTRVDERIDARGLVLLPGVVDDQVHFREPGLEWKEDIGSGSRACAKGGITTFLEMPNTVPTTTTVDRLHEKLARAAATSAVNYGFFFGATPDNLAEQQAARRTPGIKIFIGSSTGDLLVDSQEALERIFAETTLPLTAHCEDESTVRANREALEATGRPLDITDHSRIRDHRAAVVAVERALDLAARHRHRFHVLHVSTADEVARLREAREHTVLRDRITGEACPHHLFFDLTDYERLGSRVQMNPSIKTADDRAALWDALHDGSLQVIATDHAPHTLEEKAKPYPASPSGLPAVENSLALLLDQAHRGRCTLEQIAHWMCDAPARTWDLVGKGRIQEGWDADLVLVDPVRRHVIRDEEQLTRCGWSPWHGTELVGQPVRTWVLGRTVFTVETGVDPDARGREARFDHGLGGYWPWFPDS